MQIYTTGLVIDQYSDVALMKRDGESTHLPPTQPLGRDTAPSDSAEQVVRAETGLIVMAVRLAGITQFATKTGPALCLAYRCIMRGGEFEPADGVKAGFFKQNELPPPTNTFFDTLIHETLLHQGGLPYAHTYSPSLMERLRGVWPDAPENGIDWQAETSLLIHNADGDLLWQQTPDGWRLPSAEIADGQTPHQAAHALFPSGLTLRDLIAIEPSHSHGRDRLTFLFSAELAPLPTTGYDTFATTDAPDSAEGHHLALLQSAIHSP